MNQNSIPTVPASGWHSYLCKVNEELASVYVDLGLSGVAPLPEKTKLAWLWIRLNRPRDDGLSSDEEFASLCSLEDELEDAVRLCESCCYVGRITTKGRREFYFYVKEDQAFDKIVDGVLEKHSEYAFQLGEKLDASWSHYFSTLFPGKIGLEQIRVKENGPG